jgi:hypothetical protein
MFDDMERGMSSDCKTNSSSGSARGDFSSSRPSDFTGNDSSVNVERSGESEEEQDSDTELDVKMSASEREKELRALNAIAEMDLGTPMVPRPTR